MKIYTIGFTQKRAETFFRLLRENGIQRVVDIRIKPEGQLAGFTKKDDLPYFLQHLADGCQYVHMPILAPTVEMMHEARETQDWQAYEQQFKALLDDRNIPAVLDRGEFETLTSCLLCSEASPEHCHRRLVAERLAAHWPQVEVIHL